MKGIELLLYIAAAISFALATGIVAITTRVNLVALGLLLWILGVIL